MSRLAFGLIWLAALAATTAGASAADNPVADMLACSSLRGEKARLKCYEASIPALRAAFPEAQIEADTMAKALAQKNEAEAREEFGLRAAEMEAQSPFEIEAFGEEDLQASAKTKSEEIDSLSASVVEIARTAHGKIVVVLDNGQVWRQLDSDSSAPLIPKTAQGLPVRLKKAAFGSYTIRIGNSRDLIKANRIK